MKIGNRIRQLRTDQRLSLEGLAARSGISRSMLSEVERDAKSPTLRILSQLAAGLGVNISDLLVEEPRPDLNVDLWADRQVERDPETGLECQLLAPGWLADGISIIQVHLPPDRTTGPLSPHPPHTKEHLYVLSGTLSARIDDQTVTLGPGDALSFAARSGHEFRASSNDGCTFVVTTRGPGRRFGEWPTVPPTPPAAP